MEMPDVTLFKDAAIVHRAVTGLDANLYVLLVSTVGTAVSRAHARMARLVNQEMGSVYALQDLRETTANHLARTPHTGHIVSLTVIVVTIHVHRETVHAYVLSASVVQNVSKYADTDATVKIAKTNANATTVQPAIGRPANALVHQDI